MKRGFTIIELLAVIVLLGIILIVATPVMINTLNSSREKIGDEQKLAIENAARAWGIKNVYVDDVGHTSVDSVSIAILNSTGFLEGSTFNSLDNVYSNKAGVCISYESNQFVYSFVYDISDCEK